MPLPVLLHPRFPRGVDDALASLPDVELVPCEDDEEVAERVAECPVLVTFEWRDDFLGPGLRWVQSISAGVDQFPLGDLEAAGVVLTSARGVNGPPVAEHTFALLLALTRGVGVAMREAVDRVWRPRMGEELAGKTLGVLGLGTIGEEIAWRGSAWGMEVIGTKRHPSGYSGAASQVFPPSRTLEVFRRADAVVCALPDTPETRGLVDADALAALGRGWLVNVGRGGVVVEEAVLDALERGVLRGVGLDVFAVEPLPEESPLWSHPRVVITPHTAGLSPGYGPRLARLLHANLSAFQGSGEWVNRVV